MSAGDFGILPHPTASRNNRCTAIATFSPNASRFETSENLVRSVMVDSRPLEWTNVYQGCLVTSRPSDADCVAAIRSAVELLNDGDVDGYLRHFDARCQRWMLDARDPLGLADVGDGLVRMRDAFDPLNLETEALFGSDQHVCARWRLRGRHVAEFYCVAASGREIDVRQCEVYDFTGNLVTAVWTYIDSAELFRQIAPALGEEGSQ